MQSITKLPAFCRVCPSCEGAGHYRQTYALGCGQGYSTMNGPCGRCSNEREMFAGCGFIYNDGGRVPESVIAQVLTLNGIGLSPQKWSVLRQTAFPSELKKIVLEGADEQT